tara:strand:+ start:779 stop:2767 length:1989 start_codon:yes stop_codon:yes gene_type:complete
MKKKVLVRGPALSSSGYGEHARFILRALRAHENYYEIFFENINWGQTGFLIEDNEERKWMDFLLGKTQHYKQSGGQFDVSIQVTIPPEWQKLCPVNIGVTAGIETTRIAPVWIEKCQLVDKIIVPSEHARHAFDNTFYNLKNDQTGQEVEFRNHTPIEVIHYPVKDITPQKLQLKFEHDYNFLTVAQWGPRKNLDNTIKWFIEEFKDEEVGLVVKASTRKNNLGDRILCRNRLGAFVSKYPDRKCKIYLVHGNMTEEEMSGLYTHPQIKAIVSTTHGEGFGLPLFEAAYNELPVIAPNWSGHVDFLYAPKKDKKGKAKNKPHFTKIDYNIAPIQKEAVWEGVLQADSQWCFPKEHSYKSALRDVYKNYGPCKSEAKKLAKYLKENFTKDILYKKISHVVSPEFVEETKLKPEPIKGISFCIPTNGKRLEKTNMTIRSIEKQKWGSVPYEIIACGDVKNLKESKNLKLINKKLDAGVGKVATLRNAAADTAQHETIVFCDDDILLEPDWLERTIEFSENSGWKVLGNKILNPDGSRHWDRATLAPRVLVDYSHPASDKNLMQTSGFLLVRKSIHTETKWDETKIVHADRNKQGIPEDVQYNLDLHKKDIPLSFNESATIWHNDDRYTQVKNATLLKEVIQETHNITVENFFDEKFKELLKHCG